MIKDKDGKEEITWLFCDILCKVFNGWIIVKSVFILVKVRSVYVIVIGYGGRVIIKMSIFIFLF